MLAGRVLEIMTEELMSVCVVNGVHALVVWRLVVYSTRYLAPVAPFSLKPLV